MVKQRVPMQVSPEFEKRIKKLQEEIRRKDGQNISLRDITEKIIKTIDFEEMEKNLLKNISFDFSIAMDRRKVK
jgi:hypothetical protein